MPCRQLGNCVGPFKAPPRDGDKAQARHSVVLEVRSGRLPSANALPCVDCGHVWKPGERRHEYDHHKGYGAAHHLDVEPVCTLCHHKRDNPKARQTHCDRGHEFTPENTFRPKEGGRGCLTCRRAQDRGRKRPEGFWKKINDARREKLAVYRKAAKERRDGK